MRLVGRRRRGELGVIRAQDLRPDSVPAEMFRTLRTNVQFSLIDVERAILIVTSPLASEGKTFVSAHLGVAFARAGKRVFVVDADFRHPTLHTSFGLKNDVGLAEVLLGEVRLGDALKRTQVDDNALASSLYVLPTGKRPPNPAELLGSQRMSATLDALKEAAELVIVDCPPTIPVTDAGVLAAEGDAAILVAASSLTRRATLQRATEALRKSGANVIGVVLNFMADPDRYHYVYPYPASENGGRSRKARSPSA